MAAKRIAHEGYGQVELNQVAFRRDGRIEAQCKIDPNLAANYVENGMMLAIDPVAKLVKYPTADGKALLHYSTEHMYDERLAGALKDFKLEKNTFLPRLGYLAEGDKFTTNCVSFDFVEGTYEEANFWTDIANCATVRMYGHTSVDGSILVNKTADGAFALVVCGTTMPDRQKAVKFIAL